MLETSQNWELFGYDMRHLGRYWTAAWRDLLWGYDSPLRQRLDEVVELRGESGTACYQGGSVCQGSPAATCRAILLPEQLVLLKQLRVPLAAESELAAVVALEVRVSSPFAANDTGWGWSVVGRDEAGLQVALAIVSLSATMAYLGRRYDSHDAHAQEVWVAVDETRVVVQGFGEHNRESRYTKRLLHCAAILGVTAALLLVIAGTGAGIKGIELQQLTRVSAATTRAAAEASQMKSLLAVAHETIAAANSVVDRYPNPHSELTRLTHLLGDDVSIANLSISGVDIRLRGRARNAAAVMQQLTEEPGYQEVTAPQPSAMVGDSGFEQFYLDISLAPEAGE